ncbi:MAG: response regulator [Alphaproteobacteria bacterium]
MMRRRLLAILIIVLILVGHVATYKYLASHITEALRDTETGEDRALSIRLYLQMFVLLDAALMALLVFWLSHWARRLRELTRLRGECADLRKALEMERQLAEADQRMHLMFETGATGCMLLNEKGELMLSNRRAAELLELDRNTLEGANFNDLLAPQASVRLDELQRVLKEEGPQIITVPLRHKTGRVVESPAQLYAFEGPKGEQLISIMLLPGIAPEAKRPEVFTLKPDTILITDDEEMIRLVAKNMLERMGYKPLLAATGSEAIELFRNNRERIAAAVIDLIMPEMNGEETAQQIREIDPEIPILFCSGITQEMEQFKVDDTAHLLSKPFTMEEFQQAIKQLLSDDAE